MKKYICILFFFQLINVFPCSIFKYTNNGKTYFCGNEDWSAKDPAFSTIKASGNGYGIILLGWDSYLPHYPQAGINSEGLCFDWATVPTQQFIYIKNKDSLNLDSTIKILQTCKNIDEVISYISRYNYPHLAEEHIMFTDKSGNSCVIEYTKGTQKILRNNAMSQYVTNFNLTDKDAGWYPCDRYNKLDIALNKIGLNEDDLISVLDSVHQEGQYQTIYSYVLDLKELRIRIFYNHQYNKYSEYKIDELLKKEEKVRIKSAQ